jgi:hypothetical protein
MLTNAADMGSYSLLKSSAEINIGKYGRQLRIGLFEVIFDHIEILFCEIGIDEYLLHLLIPLSIKLTAA